MLSSFTDVKSEFLNPPSNDFIHFDWQVRGEGEAEVGRGIKQMFLSIKQANQSVQVVQLV